MIVAQLLLELFKNKIRPVSKNHPVDKGNSKGIKKFTINFHVINANIILQSIRTIAKLLQQVDIDQPTGVATSHIDQDEAIVNFAFRERSKLMRRRVTRMY